MELEALIKTHSQMLPSMTGADYNYIFDWKFYLKIQFFSYEVYLYVFLIIGKIQVSEAFANSDVW